MQKREIYKLENNRVVRQRRNCPRCGSGVFLAEHEDRFSCGKCGYTEFKKKK
ncbi:30S ribosomal protein S27ae [Caldiplasma sukawensis]